MDAGDTVERVLDLEYKKIKPDPSFTDHEQIF